MRLNLAKYAFGVSSRKFLDFMVSYCGIEANPEEIWASLDMSAPRTQKEVQHLIGRIAALSKFVARSDDKCKLFFKALRKLRTSTEWSDKPPSRSFARTLSLPDS